MKQKPQHKPIPLRILFLMGCAQSLFLGLQGSFKPGNQFDVHLFLPSLVKEAINAAWMMGGIGVYFNYGIPRGWNVWKCAFTGSSILLIIRQFEEATIDQHLSLSVD